MDLLGPNGLRVSMNAQFVMRNRRGAICPKYLQVETLKMRFKTPQFQYSLREAEDFALTTAKKLGIPRSAIISWDFDKKSLDVRQKKPKFQATLLLDIEGDPALKRKLEDRGCTAFVQPSTLPAFSKRECPPHVCIVGAGPSGLFAAMTFAEAGFKVDIFERGKQVYERSHDIAALMHRGVLHPESNICFGEGGAGTYSDGKLMTRTKSKYIPLILDRFVQFGADSRIRYESHPHIGTDRLMPLLIEMRKWLESKGVVYHFECRVEALWLENSRCRGIVVNGEKTPFDAVFLGIGHSADDLYEQMHAQGIAMTPKPFAIGVRVEHPQALINSIQYGSYAGHPLLPPADYAVRFNHETLPSVFSFCMCPGGRVIASQTSKDARVVNGMSGSMRNGKFANSALVVQVDESMYEPGALGGLHWIRKLEKKAAGLSSPAFAPAQGMMDFLQKRKPTTAPKTTYSPGTYGVDLHNILPQKICQALEAALPVFDRQMHGFVTEQANLIGIESRTSSPVRILRGDDYQAVGTPGLYPIGEGAGYAGGITSCALDGMSAALSLISN